MKKIMTTSLVIFFLVTNSISGCTDSNSGRSYTTIEEIDEEIRCLELLNDGTMRVLEDWETGDSRMKMAPARIYYWYRIERTNKEIRELKKKKIELQESKEKQQMKKSSTDAPPCVGSILCKSIAVLGLVNGGHFTIQINFFNATAR